MNIDVKPSALSAQSVSRPTPRIDLEALGPEARADVAKLDEAARGFEQLFVQQMLKTTDFAKQSSSEGYGSMALEAMAKSVTQGEGMGLATMIRDSLLRSELPNLMNKG
jgi:Rod binding domain-containing protein